MYLTAMCTFDSWVYIYMALDSLYTITLVMGTVVSFDYRDDLLGILESWTSSFFGPCMDDCLHLTCPEVAYSTW